MGQLTDYTSYKDAQEKCTDEALWALFDGDPENFNIAHECIDRHAGDSQRVAIRIAHADGKDEVLTFSELSLWSSRFAAWLAARGIQPGDRVAIMLQPSFFFYVAMFGTLKRGAIAVPLFTLFGSEALRLRVEDCKPVLLVTSPDKAGTASEIEGLPAKIADDAFADELLAFPEQFTFATKARDLSIYLYTSGTTRAMPAAIPHKHRALLGAACGALYGMGIRPGDKYFCPSSPAWSHGLWCGTLAPLALGVTTGTFSGKFDPIRLLAALQDYGITNFSAAPTHYRMMKNSGVAQEYRYAIQKLSYIGEPVDDATLDFVDELFRVPLCSMYGTTEIGMTLVNYPGADDFVVKRACLGKPLPGYELEIQQPDGRPSPPHQIGELKLHRRGEWISTKDLGYTDEEGYFYHSGRADDAIISAGWTMSAVEIENVLLKHPDVSEAAVIGVKDMLRGQVAKAFIVSSRPGDETFARDLQTFTRERLSQHEFPRLVEFVPAIPKTPAEKVNRKALRDQERERAESAA